MRIEVSGRASVYTDHLPSDPGAAPVTDPAVLRSLDGYDAEPDDLAEDLDGPLARVVTGGTLRFAYDAGRNELRVVTEYRSERPLGKDELAGLARQTEGMWSDGVGEDGFEAGWAGGEGRVYPNPPGYPVGVTDRDLRVGQFAD